MIGKLPGFIFLPTIYCKHSSEFNNCPLAASACFYTGQCSWEMLLTLKNENF